MTISNPWDPLYYSLVLYFNSLWQQRDCADIAVTVKLLVNAPGIYADFTLHLNTQLGKRNYLYQHKCWVVMT